MYDNQRSKRGGQRNPAQDKDWSLWVAHATSPIRRRVSERPDNDCYRAWDLGNYKIDDWIERETRPTAPHYTVSRSTNTRANRGVQDDITTIPDYKFAHYRCCDDRVEYRFDYIDSIKIIPLYIKVRDRCRSRWLWKNKYQLPIVEATSLDKATLIYLTFIRDLKVGGYINLAIDGYVLPCFGIEISEGVLVYIDKYVDITNISKENLFMLGRHIADDVNYYHGNPLCLSTILMNCQQRPLGMKAPVPDPIRYIREHYRHNHYPNFIEDHHKFIDLEEVLDLVKDKDIWKLSLIDLPQDMYSHSLCGIIIWLLIVKPQYLGIVLASGLLSAKSNEEFIDIGKKFSDGAKSLQFLQTVDLRPVFEIHNLINRISTPIDWEAEYQHRVEPNTTAVPVDFIRQESRRIFQEGRLLYNGERTYSTKTWSSFWSERLEWGTTGAFFSQYAEDMKYLKNLDKDLKNKLFFLLNMPNDVKLTEFTSRKPMLASSTSIKYEWAKQRAIYGCDVTNYILVSFCMQNCEDLMARYMAIGENSEDSVVRKKLAYVLHKRVPYCLDFEDFNSQHSVEAMHAVLLGFFDVWSDCMTRDQRLAYSWLVQSVSLQSVYDKTGLGKQYYARGTLLSGWRLTSFVNTVLNRVYFNYIKHKMTSDHHSIHSGDDILVGVKTLNEVITIMNNAHRSNIRFNPLKCFLGSVAEFLRIDHGAEGSGQYLCRAIATLVASKIENKPAFHVLDVIEAIRVRIRQTRDRGGETSYCNRIFIKQTVKWCMQLGETQVDPYIVLNTPRISGGISDLAGINGFNIYREKTKRYNTIDGILPGITHFVHHCKQKVSMIKRGTRRIAQEVQERLIEGFLREPVKFKVIKLNPAALESEYILNGIKGAFKRKDIIVAEYGRLKLIGQLIMMIKSLAENYILARRLAQSAYPLRLLKVLTVHALS